jgi:hypothetical protein
MKNRRSLTIFALLLVLISVTIYLVEYLAFHELRDMVFYTILDLAFLPIQVLLVGIVIDRIITGRELEEKIRKLNMVVGTFFSEIGNELSTMLLTSTDQREQIIRSLNVNADWKKSDFIRAQALAAKEAGVSFDQINFEALKTFLSRKRSFLLVLMENPNLLEHERFTDLLLSSFHLTEELESRPSLVNLPGPDIAHLETDTLRVYRHLVVEWLDYMQHVKLSYPFLYSHYLRIHPFQDNPSAYVT